MLLGITSDADPSQRLRGANAPEEMQAVADATADRLEGGLSGGTVYTDDRAPVEWLVDASLAQVAD